MNEDRKLFELAEDLEKASTDDLKEFMKELQIIWQDECQREYLAQIEELRVRICGTAEKIRTAASMQQSGRENDRE